MENLHLTRQTFQVLFSEPPGLFSDRLTRALQSYHPQLSDGIFQVDPELSSAGTPVGVASWQRHIVHLMGFSKPAQSDRIQLCLQAAHHGGTLAQAVRTHQAYAWLTYEGIQTTALEAYVAMAAVSGVLATEGATVVLNPSALAAFPAAVLAASNIEGDALNLLRTLPAPALYCGFVELELPEHRGVWMRTCNAHVLGLPDLAAFRPDRREAPRVFEIFSHVMRYLLETGASLGPGHTLQVAPDCYVRMREPSAQELFLQSSEALLVAETITSRESNLLR